MHELETVLGLLLAMAILIGIARKLRLPPPILLVVGGLAIGLIPGLPRVELDPELVFLLLLPPILQAAAFFTPIRDFRANLRAIGLLAVGAVLATTGGVAVVAHALIEGMTWPAAFVLGAIVSPPDAVATVSIAQRLNLPRRIVTVLEGESLVNDATALVAYRVAVAAVVTGAFSVAEAALQFLIASVGGVAIGLAAGWLLTWLWRRIDDAPIETLLAFLAGFGTYLAAERAHTSGVLAVVALGLYLGRQGPTIMSARTRVEAEAVWSIALFVLNGLVFILIGLQLPGILDAISDEGAERLPLYAVVISATVILVRIIWVFPATYLPRMASRRIRARDPYPPWQYPAIVSWAGLRGVVSLAAALALPFETDGGAPFPARDLIIFLTFCVILATLVLQGLSLAPLIGRLRVADDGAGEHEEAEARRVAVEAALQRLDQLAGEAWVDDGLAEHLADHYRDRARRIAVPHHEGERDGEAQRAEAYDRLQEELLIVELQTIVRMRDEGTINDEALRRVQRDLDLERLRLESSRRE